MADTNVVSTGEVWKDVPGFEGKYQASTYGRIRSVDRYAVTGKGMALRKGKILKPFLHVKGYHLVTLSGRDEYPTKTVHSVIASTFLGKRPDGYTINHKNGTKSDNSTTNLEYMTNADNIRHALSTGLRRRKN